MVLSIGMKRPPCSSTDSGSTASLLYQMSHGGGAFDVTFTLATASVTVTLTGSDWVGGSYLGTANVDLASVDYRHDELHRVFQEDWQLFVSTGVTTVGTPILSEGPLAGKCRQGRARHSSNRRGGEKCRSEAEVIQPTLKGTIIGRLPSD